MAKRHKSLSKILGAFTKVTNELESLKKFNDSQIEENTDKIETLNEVINELNEDCIGFRDESKKADVILGNIKGILGE